MKNFKKVVFGLLAMLVMVTGVNADTHEVNPAVKNESELKKCLTGTVVAECTLANDIEIKNNTQIVMTAPNVMLNLGGHTLKTAASLRVSSTVNAVVDNGTIELGNGKDFIVASGNLKMTSVTLKAQDTGHVLVITGGTKDPITNAVPVVELSSVNITNANGKGIEYLSNSADIKLDNVSIRTTNIGFSVVAGEPMITINGGSIVSTTAQAVYVPTSTTTKLTITSGKFVNEPISGTPDAVQIASGEVKISDGEFASPAGYALSIIGTAKGIVTGGTYTGEKNAALSLSTSGDINVSGGKFIIDTKGAEPSTISVKPVVGSKTGSLTGGEYTATNGSTNTIKGYAAEGYTAIKIGNVVYVGKGHKLDIEIDRENAKEVHVVTPQSPMLAGHEYKFADENVKAFLEVVAKEGYTVKYVLVYDDKEVEVTGDGFTMPDADATLKVSFVKAEEQKPADEQQPSDTPSSGANDGEDVKPNENTNTNPSTFDGIASIVTMAVSSLGAAGYSIKKIIRK